MSKQALVFMDGEGEAWLERNKERIVNTGIKDDPVINAIQKYKIKPRNILEVGCSNGWRLEYINSLHDCYIWGIDPKPVDTFTGHFIRQGTADDLSGFDNLEFNVVIYGWCLYLCDPEDYFKIAMEGDRVLRDGGYLIVYDFHASHPHKVKYKHKEGLFSYHYDFSKLWLGNPAYSIFGRTAQNFALGNETCVTILRKNMKNAFPVSP